MASRPSQTKTADDTERSSRGHLDVTRGRASTFRRGILPVLRTATLGGKHRPVRASWIPDGTPDWSIRRSVLDPSHDAHKDIELTPTACEGSQSPIFSDRPRLRCHPGAGPYTVGGLDGTGTGVVLRMHAPVHTPSS
jgi:hypothetical protein